jgi:hypothetical protein
MLAQSAFTPVQTVARPVDERDGKASFIRIPAVWATVRHNCTRLTTRLGNILGQRWEEGRTAMKHRLTVMPEAIGLGIILVAGIATAGGSPFEGSWHQHDAGSNSIFYFVDQPLAGVYPIVFYDDFTGLGICGDSREMMWARFGTTDPSDPNTLSGGFGERWCTIPEALRRYGAVAGKRRCAPSAKNRLLPHRTVVGRVERLVTANRPWHAATKTTALEQEPRAKAYGSTGSSADERLYDTNHVARAP